MIIKQCLQRKADNRATIDEIIFSEDFQNKAKVNKITLPKHLNKQKLMQSIQTKKALEPEERKLILRLTQRGFLPKSLENDIAMIEEQKNHEETTAAGNFNSNRGAEYMKTKTIELDKDSISDFNPNLSPSQHMKLQNSKSNVTKHNSRLVSQSYHGGKMQS